MLFGVFHSLLSVRRREIDRRERRSSLLVMVVIASREIYKANAYQFNVYKRRLMGSYWKRSSVCRC
jgi:hypothetical protein